MKSPEESEGNEHDELTPPLLRSKGVMRVLKCEVWREAPRQGLAAVGGHVLVFGRVVGIEEGLDGDEDGMGLVYAKGGYSELGEHIDLTVSKERESKE